MGEIADAFSTPLSRLTLVEVRPELRGINFWRARSRAITGYFAHAVGARIPRDADRPKPRDYDLVVT